MPPTGGKIGKEKGKMTAIKYVEFNSDGDIIRLELHETASSWGMANLATDLSNVVGSVRAHQGGRSAAPVSETKEEPDFGPYSLLTKFCKAVDWNAFDCEPFARALVDPSFPGNFIPATLYRSIDNSMPYGMKIAQAMRWLKAGADHVIVWPPPDSTAPAAPAPPNFTGEDPSDGRDPKPNVPLGEPEIIIDVGLGITITYNRAKCRVEVLQLSDHAYVIGVNPAIGDSLTAFSWVRGDMPR